jgi:putative endonuclease
MKPPPSRIQRGLTARRSGRRGEILCALWLIAKGYRVVGFRLRTPFGEIDLLARKGDILAVVEVKRRQNIDAALEAVTARQRDRLRRAAQALATNSAHSSPSVRLDLMALAPGRLPRHIPDAWRDS